MRSLGSRGKVCYSEVLWMLRNGNNQLCKKMSTEPLGVMNKVHDRISLPPFGVYQIMWDNNFKNYKMT